MSAAISKDFERRFIETRVGMSDARRFKGTAIVFNSRSVDLGGFTEIIKPEAVDRTLRDALDVRALFNHDAGKVLGRTTSGTLALRKTRAGLEINIDPPNTTFANDAIESVSRGDISGMSFGFRVLDDNWHMEDGESVREVLDMIISEVSIVSFPAYEATDVNVAKRSLQAYQQASGTRLDWLRKVHRTRLAR